MTNSENGEVLHFDRDSAKHIPAIGAVKDARWHTWTCTFGWHVQGIYPNNSTGNDVICCARSPETPEGGHGSVLATGDEDGRVSLYRFPCPLKSSIGSQSVGHSAKVTNVCFSLKTPHLLTTGGADLCVFQWNYKFDEEAADDSLTATQSKNAAIDEDDCSLVYQKDLESNAKIMAGTSFINEIKASTPEGFKPSLNAS